jgi:hypothetical protein
LGRNFDFAADDIIFLIYQNQDQFTKCFVASPSKGEMKVRGWICRGAPRWVADATLPSPLARRGDPSRTMSSYTKNHSRIWETSNDIYKIALNYSQIAQIYSDPVVETPKSEAS